MNSSGDVWVGVGAGTRTSSRSQEQVDDEQS
jgi:hypothetical protein